MQGKEKDRRAIFSYGVGYFDGNEDKLFVAEEIGFIADEPKGNNLHGWTGTLYIYGHPSFPSRGLAELNDKEWGEYLKAIEDIDPFALPKKYFVEMT